MNGIPGPGGSLGACCYCGKPFLHAVLIGSSVKQVEIDGVSGGCPVHDECLPKLEATKQYAELPVESPLFIAYQEAIKTKEVNAP